MKPARTAAALFALTLALAGCGGDEKAASGGTAGGQILEGSASDAMLPLDTVRSQPPLAPRPSESGAAKDDAGAKGEASASAAPAEAAPPSSAPEAKPSAE